MALTVSASSLPWLFSITLLFLTLFGPDKASGQCLEHQKSLLMRLNSSLEYQSQLSSKLVYWDSGQDCCQWTGVTCNEDGYVTGLDLSFESLTGGLNDSSPLFELQHLISLNLAHNFFNGAIIPPAFGKLFNLVSLNLSTTSFSGQIPVEISNLTRLATLDFTSSYSLKVENPDLRMLFGNLSKLVQLRLDNVNLSAQSNVWCLAGMTDSKKAWVEQILGTAVAKLPVRYLGIPLNSKAISFQDCTSLIDRITGRIQSWSNRFLSRAGRRLLIQSVLQSILYYWARMCILPRKVLNTVSSICARFLWKGNALGNGGFLVSWKEVCTPKAEGGLGLKNLSIMNEAMRLNQLWDMRNEADSVWKAWTRAYWTKGRDWWEGENASKTTWIIKDLEVSKASSEKCITILHNRMQWKGSGNGFTVSDTYNTLTSHTVNTDWHKIVWNRFNSPRSSFHMWLVAKNKLLTRDRLYNMGTMVDSSCVLCGRVAESRDHLFFHCQFSKEVMEVTAQFLKVCGMPTTWHLLIPWFNSLNANAVRTRMMAAAISMAAYEIWLARNSKIFRNEAPSVPKLLKKILGYLRMKIGALNITNTSFEDRRWIDSCG